VINLGTEGSMLTGCLAAYAVTAQTGNPWVGVLAGAVAGGLLALVHAIMVVRYRTNQLATGLVVLFLGLGLTSLFGASYVSETITPFTQWKVPLLGSIPWIGDIFFDQDPLVYLSYLAAPAVWWLLFRTRAGLLLRSAGEQPEALSAYGYSPGMVQILAVVVGGMFAGIGGAQLSTAYAQAWFENMTQGRGFIAVALVIFAAWDPLKAIIGAYLFSGAIALQLQLQARGTDVSQYLLQAVPYLTVIVILAALSRHRAHDAPESLSRVF